MLHVLQQHELEAALEQLLQRASSQHAADEVLGEIIMETGASTWCYYCVAESFPEKSIWFSTEQQVCSGMESGVL